MIDQNSTYTFEFRWQDSKNETQLRKRHVKIGELWEKFDLAANWRREGKPSEVRTCSFYGPGIGREKVHELAKDRLREILEPLGLVPLEPAYVGLLWADLAHEPGYHLYKVRSETVELEDYERPYLIQHTIERVDDAKVDTAFYWATERCWQSLGVWVNHAPAIVFAGDFFKADTALQDCAQVAGQLYDGRLVRASVRYDWRGRDRRPYPYMKPDRARPRIQDLRSRYPNASEDLAVVPTLVLQREYGYGIHTGISPSPAFAG